MLNNIGLPGLLVLTPFIVALVMGFYSIVKVPNSDENFNYAGFWLRLVAAILDGIIMTLITLIPAYILGYVIGMSMAATSSAYEIEMTAQALGNLLGFVVGWLYYTILESSNFQATFGKKLLGIVVVDLNGNRIGFGRANGRYFGKLLSLITLLIGHLMMGWTQQKQALYDKMAGCLVVRKNSPALLTANKLDSDKVISQPSAVSSKNSQDDSFEAEALRKFKAGEIDEATMMKLIKKN